MGAQRSVVGVRCGVCAVAYPDGRTVPPLIAYFRSADVGPGQFQVMLYRRREHPREWQLEAVDWPTREEGDPDRVRLRCGGCYAVTWVGWREVRRRLARMPAQWLLAVPGRGLVDLSEWKPSRVHRAGAARRVGSPQVTNRR
ncbi:MAG: hypothetical protein J2P58_01835 [Acidimicrobiaceae bacterium]|nr:hypothetical protein [Acidimicrobiaceae bacterium]